MKNLYKKLVPVIILCSALAGCATLDNVLKPKVNDLLVSPDFISENIYQGKFLLAPLSSTVTDVAFSRDDARIYANSFQSYVERKRPGISVANFDEISRDIGIVNYQALSDEFQDKGFISEARLQDLYTLHGITYVVFVNLYNRNIENTWDEKKEGNHFNVTVNSKQEIQVSINVVETLNGTTAWSGSLVESSIDFEFYKRYPEFQKDFGEAAGPLAVIDTLLGDDPRDRYDTTEDQRHYSERFPAPVPENISALMSESLQGFVLNLPKVD